MTTALELRPYQQQGVQAVFGAFERGVQRPAVVWPTGAGKTVGFSELCSLWIEAYRMTAKRRVLVLAHREELIEQAAAKLRLVLGTGVRVGIVKAERRNSTADVVVGSVQTLAHAKSGEARRREIVHVGLVIVDECHHAVAESYRRILEHYGCFNEGGARAVGFTATMGRTDEAGLGHVWQEVVHSREILEMVREGYLVPPRGKLVEVDDLDLRKVRKQAGDYSDKSLGDAIEASLAPEQVAKAYRDQSADRQGILFAPTVHTAELFSEALGAEGFKTGVVHGSQPAGERRDTLERYRQGDIQVLANCMVLTEGTDLPMTGTIAVARPTKSPVLYTQMVGRGLRLHPGKDDCLVLVVASGAAGNTLSTPIELVGDAPEDVLAKPDKKLKDEEELEELLLGLDGSLDGEHAQEVMGSNRHALRVRDLDLFKASKSNWQRTYGGSWFLGAGDRLIVLVRTDGTNWGAMWVHKHRQDNGWITWEAPDMGLAMAIGEANVTPAERMLTQKNAPWRKNIPSTKMENYAARYGLRAIPGMTAGELSAMIDVAQASMRIDPYVRGDQ